MGGDVHPWRRVSRARRAVRLRSACLPPGAEEAKRFADQRRLFIGRAQRASLIGGDRRSSSGSLAKVTANRRTSSRFSRLVAERNSTQRYVGVGEKRKCAGRA